MHAAGVKRTWVMDALKQRLPWNQPTSEPPSVVELPLYYEAGDRTSFAYAIFLLNKDVEQLLHAHGITSSGPNQLLANLYKLVSAAAAGLPASRPPPAWGKLSALPAQGASGVLVGWPQGAHNAAAQLAAAASAASSTPGAHLHHRAAGSAARGTVPYGRVVSQVARQLPTAGTSAGHVPAGNTLPAAAALPSGISSWDWSAVNTPVKQAAAAAGTGQPPHSTPSIMYPAVQHAVPLHANGTPLPHDAQQRAATSQDSPPRDPSLPSLMNVGWCGSPSRPPQPRHARSGSFSRAAAAAEEGSAVAKPAASPEWPSSHAGTTLHRRSKSASDQ